MEFWKLADTSMMEMRGMFTSSGDQMSFAQLRKNFCTMIFENAVQYSNSAQRHHLANSRYSRCWSLIPMDLLLVAGAKPRACQKRGLMETACVVLRRGSLSC